ncbi:MAG: exodeoxyribonuclease VII large subunit [Zoogloeaceae bacterium]|jgi:exodeoxyribonuclease VII large subunit|nr:exodeoxyribonuclease VII large subunit [Zoogloeaceae bacterium]
MAVSPLFSPLPATPDFTLPLRVGDLMRFSRRLLENSLPLCWVTGEISGLTRAASGHIYFTLKDERAQARCVLWRGKAALLACQPENGQKIEARVTATLYEARGDFQLNVENLRPAGQGALFERFLRLKARLEAEGLFETAAKRPFPRFPRHIALVTSLHAAALRDVLITLLRRAPHIQISVFPTPVQGEGAARKIAEALRAASESSCEAILLCRGGGSLEDVWAFNEEETVRAIRASRLPVISGVGHESDFTLADFAADLRAPTPTAAAEQIAPERAKLLHDLAQRAGRLARAWNGYSRQHEQRLDTLAARILSPARYLEQREKQLRALRRRLAQAVSPSLAARESALKFSALRLKTVWQEARERRARHLRVLEESLRQLNPEAVLGRGYAIARNHAGKIVRDAAALEKNDLLSLTLSKGAAQVTVVDANTPCAPRTKAARPRA